MRCRPAAGWTAFDSSGISHGSVQVLMGDRDPKSPAFQVPLMLAFREAFHEGDAAKRVEQRVGGERVVSGRGSLRRRGADEALLKRDLAVDLLSLANTVDLGSAIDISDLDYVRRSIVNFGLPDFSALTDLEVGVAGIGQQLRNALLAHEPRLRPESIHVEQDTEVDGETHRVSFSVTAEMACSPLDLPLEFVAEVEVGSGKMRLTRLPIAT
jgi:type VI secretion system protein ImpF